MSQSPPTLPLPSRPSNHQRRVVEFVRYGSGNGVVRATAGAGKTTALIQVARSLPPRVRACFLAFGRDAAQELSRRLPNGLPALTVHRLGRRTVAGWLAGHGVVLRPVDRLKYRRLTRNELAPLVAEGLLRRDALGECEEYAVALVQLVRLNLVDCRDVAALRVLALRYGLVPPADAELEELVSARIGQVVRAGLREVLQLGTTDFTDMLFAPVELELAAPRFDFVCVDEAQDYSPLALEFTMRLIDPAAGGRLLFVGDAHQSIFGFAGADSYALDRLESAARATVLPLNVSYRCPRSHVELARLLAEEIEAGPGAADGRVFWIADDVLEQWAREGDLILCRANAPLVRTCLRLVRSGRRAFLLGHDLAKQLAELGRQAHDARVDGTKARLAEFLTAELARLRRLLATRVHRSASGREHALLAERLDLVHCLRFLATNLEAERPEALAERIELMFGTRHGAVELSTIHRAKGKEADRVFILYPELMPAPYARSAEAMRGEECVQFVAITRARHDLVFVSEAGSYPFRRSPDGRNEALAAGRWGEVLQRAFALSKSPDGRRGRRR